MSALMFYNPFHPRPVRADLPYTPVTLPDQFKEACLAVRSGQLALADALLHECGDRFKTDTRCLNLQGVIAEQRGQWPLARKCWTLAARADRHYGPARRNLARYYELFTWGHCRDHAALGDEAEFTAQSPEAGHE